MTARHCRNGFNVHNVARGVTNGFHKDGFGIFVNQRFQRGNRIVCRKAHFNTLTRQHVRKQGISTAIQLRHSDNVVTYFGQVKNGVVNCRAARRYCQRANAALKSRNPLL